MSDIYLELKSRIPVVAARTHIGAARLQEAQDARGLSNERIARLIPVSEKTWRRWKDAGEIPTYALPAVANALGLELREAQPEPLHVQNGSSQSQQDEDRLDRLEALALRLLQEMESLRTEIREGRPAPPEHHAESAP